MANMAWTKIERSKTAQTGRRPNTLPTISRSLKKKDIGHLTVPVADTLGKTTFDVFLSDAGDLGFDFVDNGEYKVQPIRTNDLMVRLNIPKQRLGDCPTGTRRVELRREGGYLVLDGSYLKP